MGFIVESNCSPLGCALGIGIVFDDKSHGYCAITITCFNIRINHYKICPPHMDTSRVLVKCLLRSV